MVTSPSLWPGFVLITRFVPSTPTARLHAASVTDRRLTQESGDFDALATTPQVREMGPVGESGRGLLIVEQLSRHWGVRRLAGGAGKVVFAVLES